MLSQGLEPRPFSQRADLLLHHGFGPFLFKRKPRLGLAPSGHRKWSQVVLRQLATLSKLEMDRQRKRSVARCQGPSPDSDPLTHQPTLTTPLPPTPEPRPGGTLTPQCRVNGRMVGRAGRGSGAAQMVGLDIDGGRSK